MNCVVSCFQTLVLRSQETDSSCPFNYSTLAVAVSSVGLTVLLVGAERMLQSQEPTTFDHADIEWLETQKPAISISDTESLAERSRKRVSRIEIKAREGIFKRFVNSLSFKEKEVFQSSWDKLKVSQEPAYLNEKCRMVQAKLPPMLPQLLEEVGRCDIAEEEEANWNKFSTLVSGETESVSEDPESYSKRKWVRFEDCESPSQ